MLWANLKGKPNTWVGRKDQETSGKMTKLPLLRFRTGNLPEAPLTSFHFIYVFPTATRETAVTSSGKVLSSTPFGLEINQTGPNRNRRFPQ